ncbi:MAG: hypothetical protein ACLPKE_33615 [Streptosporangiaceae bacterium]
MNRSAAIAMTTPSTASPNRRSAGQVPDVRACWRADVNSAIDPRGAARSRPAAGPQAWDAFRRLFPI